MRKHAEELRARQYATPYESAAQGPIDRGLSDYYEEAAARTEENLRIATEHMERASAEARSREEG